MSYMSTAPAGFLQSDVKKDKVILFVSSVIKRSTGGAWDKRLICDLKIFFRKSYVLKPSQPRTK